jgi:putative flippase GtrA
MEIRNQFSRFVVTGAVATFVHVFIALLLNEGFGIASFWANFVAFLSTWPVSYAGNFFWTFETTAAHHKSMPRFGITSLTGLFVSQVIVWFVVEVMGQSLRVALVPALIIVPVLSFMMSRYWAFPSPRQSAAE